MTTGTSGAAGASGCGVWLTVGSSTGSNWELEVCGDSGSATAAVWEVVSQCWDRASAPDRTLKEEDSSVTGRTSRSATSSQSPYCNRRLMLLRKRNRRAASARINTEEVSSSSFMARSPPVPHAGEFRTVLQCRPGSGLSVRLWRRPSAGDCRGRPC